MLLNYIGHKGKLEILSKIIEDKQLDIRFFKITS